MLDLISIEDYLCECRKQDIEVAYITVDDIENVVTRLRQAEKDSARYRFMRDSGKFMETGDEFDAAVDKAMQCSGDRK